MLPLLTLRHNLAVLLVIEVVTVTASMQLYSTQMETPLNSSIDNLRMDKIHIALRAWSADHIVPDRTKMIDPSPPGRQE